MAHVAQLLSQLPQLPPTFKDTRDSILEDAQRLLQRARATRDIVTTSVTPGTATFCNTLLPLLQEENLRLAEQQKLEFLQHVSTDDSVRQASRDAQSLFAEFKAESTTDVKLYDLLVAVSDKMLNSESHRALSKKISLLARNGALLSDHERAILRQTRLDIAALAADFERNLGEERFEIWLPEESLAGLPSTILNDLERGTGSNSDSRRLTLLDSYRVLSHASDGATRRRLHYATATRCAANVDLLEKVIVLRDKAARLLGYNNHAHLQLQVDKTNDFLEDLRRQLVPRARLELSRLKRLKAIHQSATPEATKFFSWDYSYYSRIMHEQDFAIDQERIAEYFPLDVIIERMLGIFAHIFAMEFVLIPNEEAEHLVWHRDVRMYTASNQAISENESVGFLGYLYMDLHPRPGKYGHMADFPVQPGFSTKDGTRRYPVTAIVCNFPPPTQNKPSLLKHRDLWLLFHELGHAIHDLVSRTQYARFHGPETAQDFNESPSQMLENWCWVPSILKHLSQHYSSLSPEYHESWKQQQKIGQGLAAVAEKIPDELITGLLKAEEAGKATFYLGSVHRSIFDMTIHQPKTAEEAAMMDTTFLWNSLSREMFGFDRPEEEGENCQTYGQATFGSLFQGYDAGYYAYLSSQVYAKDQFVSAFKEDPMNARQGLRYRREILEKGGSEDEMDMLVRFLGRPPRTDAFYDHLGIRAM
ncbi:hypothetical protein AC578_2277 [Pseudocercospora eumusae]|uniref:Peptidase M3A/M3B catalytic domain-containing protein n=1 Tax=Pseudocercospora eumusae TaxID=321146 RepID=A0A139H0P5_9PEZI|nr:hypothetical protein AC578_2277 [Pseudocercospora eumusae]